MGFPVIFSRLRWPIEPKFSQVCYFIYKLWYNEVRDLDNTVYRKCIMALIQADEHWAMSLAKCTLGRQSICCNLRFNCIKCTTSTILTFTAFSIKKTLTPWKAQLPTEPRRKKYNVLFYFFSYKRVCWVKKHHKKTFKLPKRGHFQNWLHNWLIVGI